MTSTLITVAPTGAETAKSDVPALPTTLDELVAEAKACQAAGATLIHVHARDAEDRPSLDPGLLRETVAALRQETDLIVQLSTRGSGHASLEDRLAVIDAAPDSCSLTCGTVNVGDGVFLNTWPFMVKLFERAQEAHVVPEFELFDLGHVHELRRLIDTCGLPWGEKVHCIFVLGAPWEMPATVEMLVNGVDSLPPQVTSWSATGIGRSHLPVAAATLALGGHLRVGMEDSLMYAKGRPVRSNVELVERAARLATELQRPPMSPADARKTLGL
ncbi:MAG: 3-keto-5-aminohexanoate cleavage enzyme [Actinomycetota bacterium]|nr:3-keto-5-aminohexanoate cleavage enzyme [Actinomycetota bacterium]